MDIKQFLSAISAISEEKGISKEKVVETLEMALAAAYKRDYGKKSQVIRAKLDAETGEMSFSQIKFVVEESMLKPEEKDEEVPVHPEPAEGREEKEEKEEKKKKPKEEEKEEAPEEEYAEGEERKIRFNSERHIMLEEAVKINPEAKVGDEISFPLQTQKEYGRIAAQTAKQVILQRIREAEREAVFEEFRGREGEIVSGTVQRVDGQSVFVNIGRAVAILPPEEQIRGEHYSIGSRMKFYILLVEKGIRGPGLVLSRSHPKFISKLFELEVPEIPAGTVVIKSVAREAGNRSKIAVAAPQEGVDPVGSCVGQRGTRVSAVISELGGEKIDIIEWNEDAAKFLANSVSPAKVVSVEINAERRDAKLLVPEDQLSLAIGKGGQNVRLAAKLTGWRLDIRSAGKPEEKVEEAAAEPEGAIESAEEIKEDSK
ncbi:MAG: transcription termination factor NusA [Patescibacteria group bacterium]